MTQVIDIKSKKTKQIKASSEVLMLSHIVSRESKHIPVSDQRRRVNYVLAAYFDREGFEYRKSFESYDENPEVPESGTHKQLNDLAIQY